MILVNACEWLAACRGLPQVSTFAHTDRPSKLQAHSLLSLLPTHIVKYYAKSEVSPVVQSTVYRLPTGMVEWNGGITNLEVQWSQK